MLNFAEQTGSGAVIMVWSFLLLHPSLDASNQAGKAPKHILAKGAGTKVAQGRSGTRAAGRGRIGRRRKKNNTWDSNVVPHRSTGRARQCLTSLSRREAVLSLWYGPSYQTNRVVIM